MLEKKPLEISIGIVIRTIFVLLLLWLLYVIRDILALFFLSVILAATLDPSIDWMHKKKIPRTLGVFILYLLIFTLVGTALSFLIPPIISQFQEFTQKIPTYLEGLNRFFQGIESYAGSYNIQLDIQGFFTQAFSGFGGSEGIFSKTVGVFNFFVSIVVVLSLTFYMLVKEEGMKKFLVSVTPGDHQEYVIFLFDRIHNKIGRWMFGQLALMFIMFLLSFAVLLIFKVPFALLLAVMVGLLEIIPYLGPIIAATLITIFGFLVSPLTGLLVLGSFTALQQIEGHVIVPQVMKKAVGLNPVVVILVLLIGIKLGGIMGAILSVPLATVASIFIGDMIGKKEA
ncbi:MAG: hypothetical protein UY41_C0025G0007 [Candidatus Moranbacteria bacterium GW2011_GWE1_49_15]|nr:MAG: hypothetical protein UX75_C0038G0006 [Candidatus Moranbacteria bacterium GW2011_GWE2_47_10]KKW06453.1 MAG: hypothetical protein UY41_C0025G0007 [Candidatus Moranbacteria bacterium GW2011_GWE1_49_15]HBP00737.1 hypothetical protein [Candidatus Moranbacteria bacterium]